LRKVLSDSELLEYSREHLLYEVTMFFHTGNILLNYDFGKIEPPRLGELMRMAILESFAVHVRNLIDFFWPAKTFDTDVLAEDFFPGNGLPKSFSLTTALDNARIRANKQVSHLTTERIAGEPPEKNWPVSELLGEEQDLLLRFVRDASPARLDAKVGDFVRAQPSTKRMFTIFQNSLSTSSSSSSVAITFTWPK
jgi:hypothetical protein